MKTVISKVLPLAVCLLTLWSNARAGDLIVEENGVLPNYATIQAAVTAALPGDRIFVKNKAGNVPYQENVTITKSLSLLAFDADGVFYTFGTYTINNIANGEINIIGMYNNSGSINGGANGSLTTPTRVNILNTTLATGSVNMNFTGFVTHLSGSNIYGNVNVRTATVTGNLITAGLTMTDPGGTVTGYPEDTLYVVGNRLHNGAGSFGSGLITWSNANDYFFIANNYVKYNGTTISITTSKAGTGTNVIENNATESSSAASYGINIGHSTTGKIRVANNALYDDYGSVDNTEYAIGVTGVGSGGFVTLEYNIYRNYYNGFSNQSGAVVSMTGNIVGTSFNPDDNSGACSQAECINAGNPSTDYTDLDLTRNDIGTAGGSYNFNNFWPNQTGGARVYLVKTPRTVVQSSTINAKADSYDR